MIEINNLSFARGNSLIYKNVNFSLSQGELLLIKGANGAGKTTLLSNILNFTDPLEGRINYNGTEIDNHIASQYFLYIGETNFAFDSLTLNQNIEYWLSIHNVKFDKSVIDKVNFFFQDLNLDKNFINFHLVKKRNFNYFTYVS